RLTAPSPYASYTLSLHDALPIFALGLVQQSFGVRIRREFHGSLPCEDCIAGAVCIVACQAQQAEQIDRIRLQRRGMFQFVSRIGDRKSTRLNSSHRTISYAVFCL